MMECGIFTSFSIICEYILDAFVGIHDSLYFRVGQIIMNAHSGMWLILPLVIV